VSTPSDVRCWFYSAASPGPADMYWLSASDCGAVVRRAQDSSSTTDRRQYLAVLVPASRVYLFRHHHHVTTSTWSPQQRHLPAERRRNDDELRPIRIANMSSADYEASPNTPDFTGAARTNSTTPVEMGSDDAEEEPPNMFVVFAAMVIFTLLHIPCNLCRVT